MTAPDDLYITFFNQLMDAIRTLTDYFPQAYQVTTSLPDVSRGADYWFVVSPDAFSDIRLDAHDSIATFTTECELVVRFAEYSSRTTKFMTARGAIRKLLKAPHTFQNVRLKPPITVTGGKLRQDTQAGIVPNFIVQPITITSSHFVTN